MTFDQNEHHNILFERVAEDNTRWVWCISIHIVYKNIVFASYKLSVPVVGYIPSRILDKYMDVDSILTGVKSVQNWTISYIIISFQSFSFLFLFFRWKLSLAFY